MELRPEELREVEFRERFRGYDPDEVDDFLERAAVGVEQLHTRLHELAERVVEAERRLNEGADTEGALRHTLVLAQRTADTAVAEAQEAATKVVADANARAQAIVAEAGRAGQRMAEQSQQQLRDDIAALHEARARLQADIDSLEEYLTEERSRVRASLTELMWRLEERLDKGLTPRPQASDVPIPPLPAPPARPAVEIPAAPPQPPPPPASAEAPPTAAPAEQFGAATGTEGAPPSASSSDAGPEPGGVRWGRSAPVRGTGPRLIYTRPGTEPPAPAPGPPPGVAPGVSPEDTGPLEPISDVIEWPRNKLRAPDADDAFFAELRGALEDDEPLGPRDDPPAEDDLDVYGEEVHDPRRPGSRFRRRRPE